LPETTQGHHKLIVHTARLLNGFENANSGIQRTLRTLTTELHV